MGGGPIFRAMRVHKQGEDGLAQMLYMTLTTTPYKTTTLLIFTPCAATDHLRLTPNPTALPNIS